MKRDTILSHPEPPPIHLGMKGDRVWISLSLLIGAISMVITVVWWSSRILDKIAVIERQTASSWTRGDARELEHERRNGNVTPDTVDMVWKRMHDPQ